uniref:Uncharacterized protein n=1 Tax=Strongyloides venezuelensis TaxID=75913 RepID=A0A0K0G675_STRVS
MWKNLWDKEDESQFRKLYILGSVKSTNIKMRPSNGICLQEASSVYTYVYSDTSTINYPISVTNLFHFYVKQNQRIPIRRVISNDDLLSKTGQELI